MDAPDTAFLEDMLQKARDSKMDALFQLSEALQENKETADKLWRLNVKFKRYKETHESGVQSPPLKK